ncbi:signal peptidase II, partial [Dysosmobacter welbionis]
QSGMQQLPAGGEAGLSQEEGRGQRRGRGACRCGGGDSGEEARQADSRSEEGGHRQDRREKERRQETGSRQDCRKEACGQEGDGLQSGGQDHIQQKDRGQKDGRVKGEEARREGVTAPGPGGSRSGRGSAPPAPCSARRRPDRTPAVRSAPGSGRPAEHSPGGSPAGRAA